MLWRRYARMVMRAALVILAAGLASALLVRFSPGFGIDERSLDPGLSAETIRALQSQHGGERNPLLFYLRFMSAAAHGDLGYSLVFREPVTQLITERLPVSMLNVAEGVALGWIVALLGAVGAAASRDNWPRYLALACSGAFLSIPVAALATFCLLLRLAPSIAIAAVVFPRIWPHLYEQIQSIFRMQHILMARARGVGSSRLLLFHIAPLALGPAVALAGVSVPLAFGAAIPVEVLANVPGLGELAWRAALGRDLPVLVAVTLLLTLFTVAANLMPDLAPPHPNLSGGAT